MNEEYCKKYLNNINKENKFFLTTNYGCFKVDFFTLESDKIIVEGSYMSIDKSISIDTEIFYKDILNISILH